MFDIGELVPIVAVLGPAVVLPIVIVYLSLKHKTESEKVKKDIILAALEKDATIDVEELVKKMNAPEKLLKEKLHSKFQWGLILTFLGACVLLYAVWTGIASGSYAFMRDYCLGAFALVSVGAALLISYRVGQKSFAKEIEAEEQHKLQA